MPAAEIHVLEETELERVEQWRAEELERGGFKPADAARLAARHEVDLHAAVELLKNGCPAELAIEILL